MIRFLYQRFYYRMAFGLATGLSGYLLVVLIFSLQYRYYTISLRPLDYLTFILAGVALTELIVRSNRWLDARASWQSGPRRRFVLQALAGTGLTLFVIVGLRLALVLAFFPAQLIIFADELTIFLVVWFLVVMFGLVELGIFLNRNYRESLAELERFRKENAEYQFEMLKLQLNPHFLFNSLNTLSSLVYDNSDRAVEFIRKLSDVYRYVLDNRNRELVSLREEMEFIEAYTFLLGIRFQGMVKFRLEIREDVMDKRIAPMTMQLLIENAVKHNVASRQRPLDIRVYNDNDELWVTNNLQLKENTENTGLGLKNITSRYGFLSHRKVEIVKDGHSFNVKIPLL